MQDLSQNRGKQLASSSSNLRRVVPGVCQILHDRESWAFEEFRRSQTKYTNIWLEWHVLALVRRAGRLTELSYRRGAFTLE
jgi:hypothetical protein